MVSKLTKEEGKTCETTMNTADKIESHLRAIFGDIDVPHDELLELLYNHIFADIIFDSANIINALSNKNIIEALFLENTEQQMKLTFNSCAISFYISTFPQENPTETQVKVKNTLLEIKDHILDSEYILNTTILGIEQLLHYCKIIDKNDKFTLKRDVIKNILNLLCAEHSELQQLDKQPTKVFMKKQFELEPVKFDVPITAQQKLLQNVLEYSKTTVQYKITQGETITDVLAGKTIIFDATIFRSKLDEFTDNLIKEYEGKGNDVFGDFNKLKEFIYKQITQHLPTRREDFIKMKSGTFNHELAKLDKRKGEDDCNVKVYKNPRFKMRVSTEVGGKFLPTTQRLLNVLLSQNTIQGNVPEFTLNISDYIQLCDLKDRERAIEQITKDAKILFHSWFEWKELNSNGQMRIIEKWNKTKDTVNIKMAPSFFEIFKKYSIGLISTKSLAISIRTNPNSQHFSFKITQHKGMNYGKPNEDIMSVKTLLEGSEIPLYDEVIASDKHISQRIIEPFGRDLDALNGDFTWEYCGKNGIPLTSKELEDFSYDVFIKLNIKIYWKNFPDQTKRLEKKKQYIEEAKQIAKKKSIQKSGVTVHQFRRDGSLKKNTAPERQGFEGGQFS